MMEDVQQYISSNNRNHIFIQNRVLLFDMSENMSNNRLLILRNWAVCFVLLMDQE